MWMKCRFDICYEKKYLKIYVHIFYAMNLNYGKCYFYN